MKASEKAKKILDKYPEITEEVKENIINFFKVTEEARPEITDEVNENICNIFKVIDEIMSNSDTVVGGTEAALHSAPHIMYTEQSWIPVMPEEAYKELVYLLRQVQDGVYKDIPDEYQYLIDKLKEKLDEVTSISSDYKKYIIDSIENGVRVNQGSFDEAMMLIMFLGIPLRLSNKGDKENETLAVINQIKEKILNNTSECNSGDDAQEAVSE